MEIHGSQSLGEIDVSGPVAIATQSKGQLHLYELINHDLVNSDTFWLYNTV